MRAAGEQRAEGHEADEEEQRPVGAARAGARRAAIVLGGAHDLDLLGTLAHPLLEARQLAILRLAMSTTAASISVRVSFFSPWTT